MFAQSPKSTRLAVLAVMACCLLSGPAFGFPHWRFETEVEWTPVDVLGAGDQPHRAIGAAQMLGAPELMGFNEITGNLTRQFPAKIGPMIFNSLRSSLFGPFSENNGYTDHDRLLYMFHDAKHFGQNFNLGMFNRVLRLDKLREEDPEFSSLFMFLDDRTRVTYKEDGSEVWISDNFFNGTRIETSNFPENPSTLYNPNGTRFIFERCSDEYPFYTPDNKFQFLSRVIDRFGNRVEIHRTGNDCIPIQIFEHNVDGSVRAHTINYVIGEESGSRRELKSIVLDDGTDDATYFYFRYERTDHWVCVPHPPRLIEIRYGPADDVDPTNQQMMCFYYMPLSEWGETCGWVFRMMQGPFQRQDFMECDLVRSMDMGIGPLVDYSFDKNGRLKEVFSPSRYGYTVHYRENEVQFSQAWHMDADEHQDCCHGILRSGPDGTWCDEMGPNQPDAYDNPLFCPVHELNLLTVTIEGQRERAQVARVEDNYGRWQNIVRTPTYGHINSIMTHDGKQTDFQYDINQAGGDLPVIITDSYGRRSKLTYDEWGDVIAREPGDGTLVVTEYHRDRPGEPTWAFGTPKSVTTLGDAGWLGGWGAADASETNSYLAGSEGGRLVVKQFDGGGADPVQTVKMSPNGILEERTNHLIGLTTVYERSGNQSILRWRDENNGNTGIISIFQFSETGNRLLSLDDKIAMVSGSVEWDPSKLRIRGWSGSERAVAVKYHPAGPVEEITTGTRAQANGAPDPSGQTETTKRQFNCNLVPVSHQADRQADGSSSGYTYEDRRDCPSVEQEQAGSCTTDPADAECWRMNNMMVHYAWCEHLTPAATAGNGGEPCGCAETCRFDAFSQTCEEHLASDDCLDW